MPVLILISLRRTTPFQHVDRNVLCATCSRIKQGIFGLRPGMESSNMTVKFTNYTLTEGLIHFHVTTLFEDSKGNIWFGLARGRVYRYDGKVFTLFTTKDGLPHNTTNSIAED